ncbi:hypothetical protein ABZ832_08740 [Streptantibioticus parmotrematis]|uniref:hypothetical protein n=1 Tax=Streptantibioticus parmotrematis TaxID=2873249 RepID=UPI0033DA1256
MSAISAVPEEPSTESISDGSRPPDPATRTSGGAPAPDAQGPPARGGTDESGPGEGSACDALLNAAVVERPLEEVLDLVTELRRSHTDAAWGEEALRTAVVNRPVPEAAELAALASRPPADPRSSDDAVRTAASARPVPEVIEFVECLSRPPHDAETMHTAIEAAATRRPVHEVAELVRRLAHLRAPQTQADGDDSSRAAHTAPRRSSRQRARADGESGARRSVLRWPAAFAIALCGLVHLRAVLTHTGAFTVAEGVGGAIALVCAVLVVCLMVRDTTAVWCAVAGSAAAVVSVHAVARALHLSPLGAAFRHGASVAAVIAMAAGAVAVLLALPVLVRRVGGLSRSVDAAS